MADKKLQSLIINKLTSSQYATSSKSQDELWLVTDDDTYITSEQLATKQDIMQYTTMPTASQTNVNKIVQYTGETIQDSYTNGYFYKNNPTYSSPSATVSTTGATDSISFTTTVGQAQMSADGNALRSLFAAMNTSPTIGTITFTYDSGSDSWNTEVFDEVRQSTTQSWTSTANLLNYGFVITGTAVDNDVVTCAFTLGTMFDLSVNVDTFIQTEQPTGDETVSFTAVVVEPDWTPHDFTSGNLSISVDPSALNNYVTSYYHSDSGYQNVMCFYHSDGWEIKVYFANGNWSGSSGLSEHHLAIAGITYTGTPVAETDAFAIQYVGGSVSWEKDEATVDIANWGVHYSGTPADGDVVTVAYTAPAVTGYAWEEISVQEGGGSSIKWTGHWDAPANLSWGMYFPRFDFATLPDGRYKFYYKYLWFDSNNGVKLWTPTTVCVEFSKTNNPDNVNGTMMIVLDGNTSFAPGNNKLTSNGYMYLVKNNDSNTDCIMSSNIAWFACLPTDGYLDFSVPNAYQWTDIENIETGQKYPMVATFGTDNSPYPSSYDYYNGNIQTSDMVYIPQPLYAQGETTQMGVGCLGFCLFSVGGIWTRNVYTINNRVTFISVTSSDNTSMLDVEIYSNSRQQYCVIKKATGVFVGARVGYQYYWDSSVYIVLDNPLSSSMQITYFMSVDGSRTNVGGVGLVYNPLVEFHELDLLNIGATITADTIGAILQYTGDTNANYTNGYFYKASGNLVNVPSSVTCTDTAQVHTIDMTNVDGFIDFMYSLGYDRSWTKNWLNDSYFTYTVDSNELIWGPYGQFDSQDVSTVLGFFTFSPALVAGDYIYWTTSNFVEGHQEIQNQSWDRIDVQPAGANTTYQPYPVGWDTGSTTKDFCDDINADASAVEGMAYLGEVTFTDMPNNIGNAECVVEIMMQNPSNKTITLTLTSGNVSPYMWKYTYWNNGTNVSGWQTWQEPLVSGTNIKTINEGSLLGSGNISLVPQWSSMPQASTAYYGDIVQFVGTTDVNYTNGYFYKCSLVSTNPDAYGWVQADVQPQVNPLPSQTGNAGKFLTTDGTDASWSDKPLVNGTTISTSLAILGDVKPGTYSYGNYAIGGTIGISSSGNRNTAIGNSALVYSNDAQCATAIGAGARCYNGQGTAIGANMCSNAEYAIQLGGHYLSVSNNDTKTFKVYNGNGNYTMMSADGTIPTDRFTTTPSADGTYVPTLTISSGVATRTWGTAPSGGSVPTLTWYTVSTAGSTLTIADTSSAQLVKIYKNGLLLQPTDDYSISGTTLTMVTALVVGDKITTEVF